MGSNRRAGSFSGPTAMNRCPFSLSTVVLDPSTLNVGGNAAPTQQGPKHSGLHFLLVASMLSHFSRVQLSVTPWTVALQAPLFMGFSRQESWSVLQCPPPGDLPDPEIEPASLSLLHWQAGSLPLEPPSQRRQHSNVCSGEKGAKFLSFSAELQVHIFPSAFSLGGRLRFQAAAFLDSSSVFGKVGTELPFYRDLN